VWKSFKEGSRNMPQQFLNSFEIENIGSLVLPYKLYEVTGVEPDIEGFDKAFSTLLTKIGGELRNVVVPTKIEGVHYLAIPDFAKKPALKHTIGVHIFNLREIKEVRTVKFNSSDSRELSLAREFLIGILKGHLMSNKEDLWSDGSRSFITKRTIFHNDEIVVYSGFSFDIIVTNDKKFAVALDVTSRYVSQHTIKDLICNRNIRNISPTKAMHCLYEMCQDWFCVDITGILKATVAEQHFCHMGKDRNVYYYTLGKASSHQILEDYKRKMQESDLTVTFKYPQKKGGDTLYAASSLARPKYKTDHPLVRSVHRKSILPPDKRTSLAVSCLKKYLSKITVAGTTLCVSEKPLEVKCKVFPIPEILVGNGHVIRVKENDRQGVPLENLGIGRLRGFLNYGVLNKKSPFQQTYFLVPDTMDARPGIMEKFEFDVSSLIKQVSSQQFPLRMIRYKAANQLTLRQQFESIKKAIETFGVNSGCLIILLPAGSRPSLHDHLKKEYHKKFWIQCAKEEKLLSFFEPEPDTTGKIRYRVSRNVEGRYRSYILYFVLEVLQVHRRWISCLNSPTHYDAHIGIDVLNDFYGFTFVYNGGRNCYFDCIQRSTSQRDFKEKIPKNKMSELLYRNLKDHIVSLNLKLVALLGHRDGKVFDSEIEAFEEVVNKLKNDGLIPEDFTFGIVEIHKKSATKLRILQKNGSSQFENPMIGTCYFFGAHKKEASIATTGYPFSKTANNPYGFDGTAVPLHIRLACGNLEMEKVAEDIFRFACLAWSAPDKSCRLHLPIKLADDYLQPIASKIDDEEMYEDEEEISDEINNNNIAEGRLKQ
jgi:hypothetical protein